MDPIRSRILLLLAPLAAVGLTSCERPEPEPIKAPQATPTASFAEPDVEPTGRVIDIRMYTIDPDNSGEQHVFKPRLVSAQVGDTIRFIPTEPSHQSSSIAAMLPDVARGWEGEACARARGRAPGIGRSGNRSYLCRGRGARDAKPHSRTRVRKPIRRGLIRRRLPSWPVHIVTKSRSMR